MLPNRIKFSQKATDKLRYMKTRTGLTPNILARVAIMLTLKDTGNLSNAGVTDSDGQELNNSVLFGEHINVYDVMIHQYIYENEIDLPIHKAISAMVEAGLHKMGHVKQVDDICDLI